LDAHAAGSPAAERLILIDPATGKPLSRLQTWLAIMVMLSGTTFVALVVTAVAPIMHLLAQHFGGGAEGKTVAYGLATVPSIGIMIGAPITGWMIERFGSRNFLLVILLVFGFSGSAGLYLDNLPVLIATRFILGVAAAGIVTATLIMIAEYFDPDTRARVLGYQASVGAISALLIILSAGPLAEWAGLRAPFALYLLAFPVFIAAAVAIPKRPAVELRRAAMAQASAWSALAAVWIPIAVITALFLGSFMPTLQVSFLLAVNGVLKPSNQSLVLAASALMVGAGSAMYGPLRHRFSDRTMLTICAALIGAGIVVMGLSHEAIQVAVGCGISGIGTGLLNPQANNMLISRAAPNARGRSAGLGYTARYTGDFINPVIVGPLAVAIGLHGAFVVVGGVFMAAAAIHLLFHRLTPASA
jgi:MFS family permease